MPRGERQTTGTAQALLGAKQIAAGERASKRQESIAKKNILADYVKTGIGALKGVGDYLQKKQALEQNQEKLTLEQSLFSAQFGPEEEWKPRRDVRTRYEEAIARQQEAKGKFADPLAAAEVKKAEIDIKKGRLGIEGMTIANKVADIRAGFAEGLAQGNLDLVKAQRDKLLQDIKSAKAQTTDAEEGRRLESLRLDIHRAHIGAVMGQMVSQGILNDRQFDLEMEKWNKTSDPKLREAMLSDYDKRLREVLLKKEEAMPEQIKASAAAAKLQTKLAEEQVSKTEERKRRGETEEEEKEREEEAYQLKLGASEFPALRTVFKGAAEDLKAGNVTPKVRFARSMSMMFRDESSDGQKLVTPGELSSSYLDSLAEKKPGRVDRWVTGRLKGTDLIAKLGTVWHNTPTELRPELAKWLKEEWPQGEKKLMEIGKLRDSEIVDHQPILFADEGGGHGIEGVYRFVFGRGDTLSMAQEYRFEKQFAEGLSKAMGDPAWAGSGYMNFPDNVQDALDMIPPSMRVSPIPRRE